MFDDPSSWGHFDLGMRLRDKVAAMFDVSGTSCSDDSIDGTRSPKKPVEQFSRDQKPVRESHTRQASVLSSQASASNALSTPAPQKHPRPMTHVSIGHGQPSPLNHPFRSESEHGGPHVPLLMLRKGTLDCLAKNHADVSSSAVALLVAASSLALPLGKSSWEHVKPLILQRRYISMLSRVILDFDSQSPFLQLPREYLSKHSTPPVFQASSDASHGLIIIHNWLVLCILARVRLRSSLYFHR